MIKNIVKTIYILFIKIFDKLCLGKSDNKNITIFMTFKEDIEPIIKSLSEKGYNITVIYHPKYENVVKEYQVNKTINMKNKFFLQQIYAIKKSRILIIDTYYLILGSITKPNKQTVIQTWHATGALKKFGLEDKSVDLNNNKLVQQYLNVYHYTDYYLVGSDIMGKIFEKSLDAKPSNMLKIGLPRLDSYSNISPNNNEKKIALYVPTYRDYDMKSNIKIDKEKFEKNCPEYSLITKLHPAINTSNNSVTNDDRDTQQLMEIADIIITDYSSLSIEAAFLNKIVVFYSYDEDIYNEKRGLNDYYYEMTKENKAYNIDELYELVNNHKVNTNLKDMWHTYNNGDSMNLLLEFIEKEVN